jgi:glycosyltransferase involved in cell wall biosynthesis
MVEVAREVARRSDHIRFELAGDGPEGNTIRELIGEYGLENCFRLRGFVENMSSFYSGLNLYLNTSADEGIPISVLEAMAHSVPVIAADVGGIGEIVHDGVEGYLIKSREPKAFADKCLELFHNRELRSHLGVATRNRVIRKFSADQMSRSYYRLYMKELGYSR